MEPPFVDQHSRTIPYPRDVVWRALTEHATGDLLIGPHNPLALILGTKPRGGFEIADSVEGKTLDLVGRHHFSNYLLRFELEGDTKLSALTYAAFPGPHGRLYRLLVITSGAHAIATRGILRSVAQAAERKG
ncbi:hypothetical protein [Kribbella italica]|uniref:SRPBCC family protein n=1 Tax=Kribbella italica TaxID=1540520 RepID=A0A7W9J2I4_9ACTN|nr:hypothetical protein [Kribbella italica]MBB5833862.1 hypothetical protein [Kribbella italica]